MSYLPNRKLELPPELESVRRRHPLVVTIVSPPRCCSTAFARVFWEHPRVAFYSHEPFEIAYFRDASLEEVARKLNDPLALSEISRRPKVADALLIKEMPYQVGPCFPHLAAMATPPLIFLLRDPRLSVASRMGKKRQIGDSPIFPLVETGWELLREQVDYCDRQEIPYIIVRADDFCDRPREIFPEVFSRLGLDFSDDLISWDSHDDLEIDNLGGDHSHLYRTVLASTGIRPEETEVPKIERFPSEGGFREHLPLCLEIYEQLSSSPRRIGPVAALS